MTPLPDGYTLESVAASACPHADARQAAAIAEACFQSARDPTQMPIDDATVAWLLDTVPAYWNLIKYQGVVIGSALILPTTRVLMQGFLCAELTEADLWAALRQTPIRSAECCYLAGAALAGAPPAARVGPGQPAGVPGPLPGARPSPALPSTARSIPKTAAGFSPRRGAGSPRGDWTCWNGSRRLPPDSPAVGTSSADDRGSGAADRELLLPMAALRRNRSDCDPPPHHR